jgi:glutamate synthase (NADPH/NADH) small chain
MTTATTSSPWREKLPAQRLELLMPDLKPALNDAQARAEAERCLYCHDAPCIAACPTGINIPEFIRKIASGNLGASARTILSANILGYSCALVCPVEVLCVGACVYNHMGRPPIQIGLLQRFAVERGAWAKNVHFFAKGAPTGYRVALIGAGPSSLSCAHELTRLGHEAVCLEARELPGGLNTTGCAPYKIRSDDALREVDYIKEIGFEVRTGVAVGNHVSLADLESNYDAVFLGVGLGPDSRLGLHGEDVPGVWGACALIEKIKNQPSEALAEIGGVQEAVVIGGGNTAIDIARELAKIKIPRVTMVYRRSEELLSAYKHEIAYGRKEGVELRFWTQPVEYLRGTTGRVRAVKALKTEEGPPDARGQRKLVTVQGSEHEISAQIVAVATGQEKLVAQLKKVPGLEISPDGRIVVDPKTGATGNSRYFSGGDAANGGKEVVNATAEGKVAARGIDAALRSGKLRRGGK